MIGDIIKLGSTILDKIFPDKEEAEKAKIRLLELQEAGELKELDASMNNIIAEAKSADKWTSRARPSFMYVMYAMILMSLPMGILHAYNPQLASSIALGLREWLAALPDQMWWLFGVGYLGYGAARTIDKHGIFKKK